MQNPASKPESKLPGAILEFYQTQKNLHAYCKKFVDLMHDEREKIKNEYADDNIRGELYKLLAPYRELANMNTFSEMDTYSKSDEIKEDIEKNLGKHIDNIVNFIRSESYKNASKLIQEAIINQADFIEISTKRNKENKTVDAVLQENASKLNEKSTLVINMQSLTMIPIQHSMRMNLPLVEITRELKKRGEKEEYINEINALIEVVTNKSLANNTILDAVSRLTKPTRKAIVAIKDLVLVAKRRKRDQDYVSLFTQTKLDIIIGLVDNIESDMKEKINKLYNESKDISANVSAEQRNKLNDAAVEKIELEGKIKLSLLLSKAEEIARPIQSIRSVVTATIEKAKAPLVVGENAQHTKAVQSAYQPEITKKLDDSTQKNIEAALTDTDKIITATYNELIRQLKQKPIALDITLKKIESLQNLNKTLLTVTNTAEALTKARCLLKEVIEVIQPLELKDEMKTNIAELRHQFRECRDQLNEPSTVEKNKWKNSFESEIVKSMNEVEKTYRKKLASFDMRDEKIKLAIQNRYKKNGYDVLEKKNSLNLNLLKTYTHNTTQRDLINRYEKISSTYHLHMTAIAKKEVKVELLNKLKNELMKTVSKDINSNSLLNVYSEDKQNTDLLKLVKSEINQLEVKVMNGKKNLAKLDRMLADQRNAMALHSNNNEVKLAVYLIKTLDDYSQDPKKGGEYRTQIIGALNLMLGHLNSKDPAPDTVGLGKVKQYIKNIKEAMSSKKTFPPELSDIYKKVEDIIGNKKTLKEKFGKFFTRPATYRENLKKPPQDDHTPKPTSKK